MNTNKKKFCLYIVAILLVFGLKFTVFAKEYGSVQIDNVYYNNLNIGATSLFGNDICTDTNVKKVLVFVGYIILLVKILIPLIIMIRGTVDLFQAVTGSDEKDLPKNIKTFVLRIVLGIVIFFIPNIINATLGLVYDVTGANNTNNCVTCLLDPNNC